MVAPGEMHYTVTTYVLSDGSDGRPVKALLLDHPKLGVWMPPGGHQEPFENAFMASIRETREETGIDIYSAHQVLPLHLGDGVHALPMPIAFTQCAIAAYGDTPAHFHLDIAYVVHVPEQPIRPFAGESRAIGWFTFGQIAEMNLFADVRALLAREMVA